jgi:hypothetical protein
MISLRLRTSLALDTVDVWDLANNGSRSFLQLSQPRYLLAGVGLGGTAVFGGGLDIKYAGRSLASSLRTFICCCLSVGVSISLLLCVCLSLLSVA